MSENNNYQNFDDNNQTPNPGKKKKKSGASETLKRFGIGLAGGLLGAALIVGGYAAFNSGSNNTTTNTNTTSNTSGTTQVSNVSVNVNSDITDAVSKVQDAIVSVINYQASTSMDMFGNTQTDSSELTEYSEGSGVIYNIDGDTAYIVTNNHVISGADSLSVLLSDGTSVDAELVGTDEYSDIAVLKVSSEGIDTTAEFGDSDALTVGEPAIAIGSPLGTDYANSVTSGIVSSLNREVQISTENSNVVTSYAIQTDAAINPGNSGGALVNIEGQVIGINSSKITSTSSGESVEGIGFAIPSNDVVKIINQLVENGEVTRPGLGVKMYDLSFFSSQQREQYLSSLPEDVTSGAVIASVVSGSPADEAGLQQYDVITAIDGEEVTSSSDLKSKLYDKSVGDSITVTYYRDGEEQTVTVNLTMTTSDLNTDSGSTTNSN
ncbi:S1C family serine protease [Enterococcus sp. HY326]|uniref:S1C family serine protease n=1 Tax=Enterococcus sp. HY326 TaxID=2971265 RepID=UPI00223F8C39|nr:trypsin-like peptidase domain-containing protein [Enterococcus sp. HY326]